MKKLLILEKRRKAKELHAKGWSNKKIAKHLISNRSNISKWINMNESEILVDNRGWQKDRLRKHSKEEKRTIRKIRRTLEKENSFFIGAKVVQKNYENQTGKKISKSFVDSTLKEAKLVKTPRKKRKGVSKYMKYPQHTLDKLGRVMMAIDFIGPKYLKGSSDRINFLSCKYIRPAKEGIVKRIDGQTSEQTIKILKDVWRDHPIPEVLKIDNDSAFGAIPLHKKCIGAFTLFLLNLGISPLYIAQRSPWNNGHVEGFNSVFSKKFWNKLQFTDEDEIDIRIEDFNIAYKKYSNLILNNPENLKMKYIDDFKDINLNNKNVKKFMVDKIYFLRKVMRKNEKGSENEYGSIDILKEEIKLPKNSINMFVFCEINLKLKKLKISNELDDGKLKQIKKINFKIKNINYL